MQRIYICEVVKQAEGNSYIAENVDREGAETFSGATYTNKLDGKQYFVCSWNLDDDKAELMNSEFTEITREQYNDYFEGASE